MAARDAGEPLPNAAVTLSAWTDLAVTGKSLRNRAKANPMLTRGADGMRTAAQTYRGEADLRTPLASPLYGDLGGLPPLPM
jgi:acetyl esterase/lipase